jgi:hypothetical protein
MRRGTITDEDAGFVETWENIAPQQNGIIRLDTRGDEKPEIISGRRTFMITTEERIITQDRIRDEKYDPFLNGCFRPIVVPDSVTVESNPNALSDEEISKIFKSSDLAWGEWLSTIDSVATLRRMLELAEGADISLRRYRELEERLVAVRGQVRLDTNDPALKAFLSDRPNPNAGGSNDANAGADNPRRAQAGRSSTYR